MPKAKRPYRGRDCLRSMCATMLFLKCSRGNGISFTDALSCRWRTCLREVSQNSMHKRICLRRKSCFCKCYVNLQRQSSETSTLLYQIVLTRLVPIFDILSLMFNLWVGYLICGTTTLGRIDAAQLQSNWHYKDVIENTVVGKCVDLVSFFGYAKTTIYSQRTNLCSSVQVGK